MCKCCLFTFATYVMWNSRLLIDSFGNHNYCHPLLHIHQLLLGYPEALFCFTIRLYAQVPSLTNFCLCLQGMSETFSTLHNLVHKGVKVVMDIPFELWNETSAEVADLKKQVGPVLCVSVSGYMCVLVESSCVGVYLWVCICVGVYEHPKMGKQLVSLNS